MRRTRLIIFLTLGGLLILVPLFYRMSSDGLGEITPHTAEYFPVQDPLTEKWGFIDNKGEPLTPMVFDWAGDYRQGLGLVETDGAMGYINTTFEETGEWAITPRFLIANEYDQAAFGFFDGLARARDDVGQWGYIDTSGVWAIAPTYTENSEYPGVPVGDFAEGLAWYQTIEMADRFLLDDEEIVRDEEGKPVREPYQRRLFGFIDRNGEVVIEPRFEMVQDFGEGLAGARFKTNDRWGFIDRDGRRVISPQYEGAGRFSEGLCAVQEDGLWGYIDREGEWVIAPTFEEARQFLEGVAPVREGDRWGYINAKGNWAIAPTYDNFEAYSHPGDARVFENGIARVTLDGKAVYIDKTGEVVWPRESE